jgi:hypothetical protein
MINMRFIKNNIFLVLMSKEQERLKKMEISGILDFGKGFYFVHDKFERVFITSPGYFTSA